MKLARFHAEGEDRWGIVDGEWVAEIAGSPFGQLTATEKRRRLADVEILPPGDPSKLIAVGLNYADHAREQNAATPAEPRIFFKAPSSIIGPEDAIVLPIPEHRVDHEAELVVVMKRKAKNVEPEAALAYVLGYTCGNDVSDRVIQKSDGMPTRAKSFDTFSPLGPFISTDLNPNDLKIECLVNGQVRQSSHTSQLLFDVPTIVSFVSKVMTLLPGDMIMTGTPAGVGPLKAGDEVEVRIEGIGSLRNPVRLACRQKE